MEMETAMRQMENVPVTIAFLVKIVNVSIFVMVKWQCNYNPRLQLGSVHPTAIIMECVMQQQERVFASKVSLALTVHVINNYHLHYIYFKVVQSL